MPIFEGAMNNCLFARFSSQLSWKACWRCVNCPAAGRCGEEGTEESCRSTVTVHVPAPAGMSKCKHGDCLTDLFYYERKIWDSSSLITVLTSDNFTPLLFNGNITHAILKMEKHFPVLFKSEMMYETERLGGVRWCWEQLMKFRFERIWDEAEDASKTVSKEARTWEVIKARADGTDLRFWDGLLPEDSGKGAGDINSAQTLQRWWFCHVAVHVRNHALSWYYRGFCIY